MNQPFKDEGKAAPDVTSIMKRNSRGKALDHDNRH